MTSWQKIKYLVRGMLGLLVLELAMRILPDQNKESTTVALATLAVIDRMAQQRKSWEYST